MRHGLLIAAIVMATACDSAASNTPKRPLGEGAPGAQPMGTSPADALPPGLNASAAARLDSGNVAFRSRQYEQALHYYRAAALDVPEHPAPWYGIYMVATATGNRVLADSATKAVGKRSGGGELLDTGVAKTHKAPETPMGLPPKHPAVKPLP